MRILIRLVLAVALLITGLVAGAGTALAQAETITVACSNGFERTVSARAARGVAKSLTKFNAFNQSGVTCTAGPGAPRPRPATARLTITCTNGFERTVSARAAGGITRALNAFNQRNRSGVTCSAG